IDFFYFDNNEFAVDFVETSAVTEGVECDVYKFAGDDTKDLGIIRIKAGYRTPLQKVLKGDKTIEGYISGKGKLVVTDADGAQKEYVGNQGLAVEIKVGEMMQWQADADSDLTVYEICFPPYDPGRFENLY
ncbi:MAG: hypothetical protein MUD10_00645, partial [Candidatus Pacebacteria bacterium]|nr:hypothetical protein [Candidatus Paceibacterota bacterium]